MNVKLLVNWGYGAQSKETWKKTSLFCPDCGRRSVWAGGGEQEYVGEEHLCIACKVSFYLPTGVGVDQYQVKGGPEVSPTEQRVAAILEARHGVSVAPVLMLYPSQVAWAKKHGWVRGREYRVYSCLTCLQDMDQCKCEPKGGKRARRSR